MTELLWYKINLQVNSGYKKKCHLITQLRQNILSKISFFNTNVQWEHEGRGESQTFLQRKKKCHYLVFVISMRRTGQSQE